MEQNFKHVKPSMETSHHLSCPYNFLRPAPAAIAMALLAGELVTSRVPQSPKRDSGSPSNPRILEARDYV